MVDFSLNDKDQEILDELSRQVLAARKYARYYDVNEEELPPDEFPEAKEFDHIRQLYRERRKYEGHTTTEVFTMLTGYYETRDMSLRTIKRALGNVSVYAAGTQEQIKKWGRELVALAGTESTSGSDSKVINTTAVLDGDEWVLNGEKLFVSTGMQSDGVVVWATLDKSAGRGAIKAFYVEKGTPGFHVEKKEKKLGIRVNESVSIVMKDCRIPRENLLGLDETIKKTGGGGFKGLMATFNLSRPHVSVATAGRLQICYEFIVDALKKEGVEVDWEAGPQKQSALQQAMIELKSYIEVTILTALRSAWLVDMGEPNNLESAVSKAIGGDAGRRGAQVAVEILGAMGITHDQLVEKYFRDARITDIYEGTGEIMRLIIARGLLNYSSADLM